MPTCTVPTERRGEGWHRWEGLEVGIADLSLRSLGRLSSVCFLLMPFVYFLFKMIVFCFVFDLLRTFF